jgi:hypothetical protein
MTQVEPRHVRLVLRAWDVLLDGHPQKLHEGLRDGRSSDGLDANAWEVIGGYLAGSNRQWTRLAGLRQAILGFVRPVRDPEARLILLGMHELCEPNEFENAPEYLGAEWPKAAVALFEQWAGGHRRLKTNRQDGRDSAVQAAAANMEPKGGTAPDGRFEYWPLIVEGSGRFRPATPTRRYAVHSFEARMQRLLLDSKRRGLLIDDFERYLRRAGIGLRSLDQTGGDPVALFRGELQTLDDRAVAMVYRACKKAVYLRAGRYLDIRWPGWRESLNVTTVLHVLKLDPADAQKDAVMPVPREWLRHHLEWIEPYDAGTYEARLGDLQLEAIGRSDPVAVRKLAARIELAFSDVLGPRRDELYDQLVEELIGERVRSASIRDNVPSFRTVVRMALEVNRYDSGAPAPAPAVRQRSKAAVVDELRGRIEASRHDRADGPPAWLLDHEWLHDSAVALVSTNGLREEKRRLAELMIHQAAHGGLDSEDVKGILATLNFLAVTLLSDPAGFPPGFTPHLVRLCGSDSGPFAATLLRCLALAESKRHRYGPARMWLQAGLAYLERERTAWQKNDRDLVALAEAEQQLWLASGGTELRILEYQLASPFLGRAALTEELVGGLQRQGWQAETASARGVERLLTLATNHPLPSEKRFDRASSTRWKANSQIMFIRGLLLQATIDAVELDLCRAEGRTIGIEEKERSIKGLIDAAKLEYGSLTENRLDRSHILQLTQLAMHYAFLNGMKLMEPNRNPENRRHFPAFLTSAPNGQFDIEGATSYLVSCGHNAGILANITSPQIIDTIDRRSMPSDLRRQHRAGADLSAIGPYRVWRQSHWDEEVLRRKMGPRVGGVLQTRTA